MSIILAPDSFKGSLSAAAFCRVAAPVLQARAPREPIHCLPLADGGEGTLDCLLAALGGEKRIAATVDALGRPIEAPIGILPGGTAVIEAASAAGLPQLRGRENPERATTYGLGLLIRAAAEAGAKSLLLTLGGTGTHDLGLGMMEALGWRFFSKSGAPLSPCGGNMGQITRILPAPPLPFQVTALCDVKNPLLGAQGAARIFAPQKGADPAAVERLEQAGRQVAALCGAGLAARPGAGAAGGLGYAVLRFLGGTLTPGIDHILSLYHFNALLKDCKLLITGEGCFDAQSAMGKGPGALIRRANPVPAVVIAGITRPFDRGLFPNLKEVYAIGEGLPREQAMREAETLLRSTIYDSQLPYPYLSLPSRNRL